MLPTEDLFACVYVLIDDLVAARIIAIPPGPGPAPACSDAELLAIAQVRYLLGRRSEAGFLAEVTRDWADLFPHLPHQSEASRRIRWLRGASGQLRCHLARQIPADDCQQIDTSALPVKHGPRVRGPAAGRDPMAACPVRPRRRARRMVLRLPAGHQDGPGQPHRPRPEHRPGGRERARRGQRPAGGRATAS